MWFQKNKWKIVLPVLVIAVLAAAFCFSGNAPVSKIPEIAEEVPAADIRTETNMPAESELVDPISKPTETTPKEPKTQPAPEPSPSSAETVTESVQGQYRTDPVPEGKPLPAEPQDAAISTTAYTCTISISCDAVLENMDALDSAKTDLIPADGWILPPTSVTFYEGESVFNVLQRTCKQQKIHMEFEDTPIYNSAYIEGIHNLYEFDAGALSGWMYSVNAWFPNYGCSRYAVQDGDEIFWVYTCDLGRDVGGEYSAGNGRG